MALPELLRNRLCALIAIAVMGCNRPVSESERMINSKTGKLEMQNGLMYESGSLYSGAIYTLYAGTKDTAEVTGFISGKEHGTWKKFFPNGKLKAIREYGNGKKIGEYIAWWDNGNRMVDYLFANDEYNGTCKEWNRDGIMIKEMNYKKGYEDGMQRSWFDNGKIRANYKMIEGRRYGLLGTKNCVNASDSIF